MKIKLEKNDDDGNGLIHLELVFQYSGEEKEILYSTEFFLKTFYFLEKLTIERYKGSYILNGYIKNVSVSINVLVKEKALFELLNNELSVFEERFHFLIKLLRVSLNNWREKR